MLKGTLRWSVYIIILCCWKPLQAQVGCGFTCNEDQEAIANAQLNTYILAAQSNLGLTLNSTCSNLDQGDVKLPVVFHLIYPNGTSAGTNSNWTDVKVKGIVSQLNDLFEHTSGASFSNLFSGANIEFEFVLAQRDPANASTNGIIRHITPNYQSVGMSTDTPMKTDYNWDPNRYINVYVVDNVIGAAAYALFPSFHGNVRDGLVVDGGSGTASLMTHELGHYFGLYHTFQGGCSNDDCLTSGDWVCDTPPKTIAGMAGGTCTAPVNSCTTDDNDTHDHNPLRAVGLGGIGDQVDGLENYMDYTGNCYGAFTQGQRERMRATLFSIRSSLINENVYSTTVTDIALETVVFPGDFLCNKLSDVTIEIKNNGNTSISNIPLTLEVNGVGKKNLIYPGPLLAGASAQVIFTNILFGDGINSLITYTDWNLDGIPENNMACSSTTYIPPLKESIIDANFEKDMGEWTSVNPDNLTALKPYNSNKCSANKKKILAYESLITSGSGGGNHDYLVSKTIDLTDAISATIDFDYSYKNFYSNLQTSLSLEASNDCGTNYSVLDSKTSFALNTTTFDRIYTPFYPKSCADWKTESIDLSAYLGKEITLRFHIELEGSQGQNLFLDNINIEIVRNNIPDCNNDIGGTAAIDACGICSGGLTGLVANASCVDCNNEVNGTAALDFCGTCSGGSTNILPDATCTDCNGDVNGTAAIDGCGECTGGNTGIVVNSGCIDCDGIPGGNAIIDSCGVCAGGTTGLVVNATCLDCNDDPNGTAGIDACGACAGGRTGVIPDVACTDCNGDLGGIAEIDLCGVCAGGATGVVVNVSCTDCNGDVNGTATIDGCNICSGGNTNIVPNSICTDCAGIVGGSAVLDACGDCSGGTTGNTPDNSCVNPGGCAKITVTPGVFCADNSSVQLVANSESESCNNLTWYSNETGGTSLATGCIFNTPNLSAERSYYVEDNVNLNTVSNSGNFVTGFSYNSNGLSNFQSSGLNSGQYVRFTANETTVFKSVNIHFSDCNNFTRFRVRLDKVSGSGSSQSKTITPGCNTGSPTTLNLDFNVVAGTVYNLYIDNLQKNQSGNWQNGNGSFRYHQQLSGGFSNYFSATKLTVQNIQGYQGTGPFYDWTFASTCPRTEVKVFKNCFDICGNGIDDDNDGQIDEACADFSCNGRLLQTLGNTLYSITVSPLSIDPMFTLPWGLNATAYNPTDNKVYATIDQGGAFIRIDADGNYEELGFSRKPNGDPLRTWSADMGSDGTYYIWDVNEQALFVLDIKTMLATEVVSNVPGLADIAYNPQTGKLYGINGLKHVIEIDPIGGSVVDLGRIQGVPGLNNGGGVGAVYFSPDGRLIAYGSFLTTTDVQNDMVTVDLTTLQGKIISKDGVATSNNDGASCPYSVLMSKSASVTSVLPGEEFEYTIDVLNASAFDVSNVNFIDVLPRGLSVVSIVKNELGALTNDITIRSDIVEIQNFDLSKGATELRFRVKVDESFICDPLNLPNQATLSSLPATLGSIVVSDDPSTFAENDTTFVIVEANVPAILDAGTLSSAGGVTCEFLQDTLRLIGSTGEISWEQSSDGVNWVNYLGESINDSVIVLSEQNTGSTLVDYHYRAVLTSLCNVQYNPITYSLSPQTPRPLVNNSQYCLNDVSTVLTAVGTDLKWYTSIGGIAVTVGPLPQTTIDGVTNYYVTQTLNGCESEASIQDVVVTTIPDAPDLGPYEYCRNEPGSSLNLGTSHVSWYESLTDITPSGDEPFIDFDQVMDTTFYVSYTIEGCESSKAPLQVVINDYPEAPFANDTAYCVNDVALAINAVGTNLLWYTTSNLSTSAVIAPVPLTTSVGTSYYYVTQISGMCEGPSDTLEVIIHSLPLAPVVSDSTYCQNEPVDTLKAVGDNLLWYSSAVSTSGIIIMPTVDSSIVGVQSFFVSQSVNSCEGARSEVQVEIFDLPDASFDPVVDICPNSTTNLEITITGGLPNYTLVMAHGLGVDSTITGISANTKSIVINDSGTYYLKEVRDTRGCKTINNDTIHVNEIVPLKIASPDYACYLPTSEYEALFTVTGGIAPYVINGHNDVNTQLSDSGVFTSDKISYLVSGDYTFDVTDASGCVSNTSIAITAPYNCGCSIRGSLLGEDTMVCIDDSLEYSVEISGGLNLPYEVFYHFENGVSTAGSISSLNTDGIYSLGFFRGEGVLYLDSIADLGCSVNSNDSLIISNHANPYGVLGNIDTVCLGNSAYLNFTFTSGTAPYTVELLNALGILDTLSGVLALDSTLINVAGTYKLKRITDANGCTNNISSAADLNKYDELLLSHTLLPQVCVGDTSLVRINSSRPGTSFIFDLVGPSGSTHYTSVTNQDIIKIVEAGVYTIENPIEEVYGCLEDTVISFTVVNDPENDAGTVDSIVACLGDQLYFKTTGYVGDVFDWEFNSGTWDKQGVNADSVLTVSTAAHQVRVIVSSTSVCPNDTSDVSTLTLNQIATKAVITPIPAICSVASFKLTTVSIQSGESVKWQRLDTGGWIDLDSGNVLSITDTRTTTALDTVYYRVLSYAACSMETGDSVGVVIGAQPTLIDHSTVDVCKGDLSTIKLIAPIGNLYTWSTSPVTGGAWVVIQSSDKDSIQKVFTENTKIRVEGEFADQICPTDVIEFIVSAIDIPAYDQIISEPVCHGVGSEAVLTNVEGSVSWFLSDGTTASSIGTPSSSGDTLLVPAVNKSSLDDINYKVYATINACGQTLITDEVEINSYYHPSDELTVIVSCEEGAKLQLTGNSLYSIVTWEMNNGEKWDDFIAGDMYEIYRIKNALFRVLLANPSNFTCQAYTNESLVAFDCPIVIPEAISPNGDDKNDVWKVTGLDQFEDYETLVLNRYGLVIHKQTNKYIPWNGTFNGKPVPVGTYYYIINIKGEEAYTGSLTIIR